MKNGLILLLFVFLANCVHKSEAPIVTGIESAAETELERNPSAKLYTREDREMKTGELTVWTLQKMAQDQKFTELNQLFNNGRSMARLPAGYSAGAGARVLKLPGAAGRAIDNLTGTNWKGKYFYPGTRDESHGLNRIRKNPLNRFGPIVLQANFTTKLLNSHSLVPEAKSNLVILNYANPVTNAYPIEVLLKGIQVYDVMVAVPGKYGPLYIGKTWLGIYDKNKNFSALNSKDLVAWFFLDFNSDALIEQGKSHWDRSKEYYIDGKTNF